MTDAIIPLRIAVTGEGNFARRHAFLFEAMQGRCLHLDYATTDRRTFLQRATLGFQELGLLSAQIASGSSPIPRRLGDLKRLRRRYILSPASYKTKTLYTESLLRSLDERPDVIFHIFSLFRAFWEESRIPAVHYLDYTAAMLRRNWPPNYPLMSDREFNTWLSIERTTYDRARHLFTMSEAVATSLELDYGVSRSRMTVVGCGGQFRDIYRGQKTFGSRQLLFNARPFALKGGDIILSAFEIIRRTIPDAKLVVVGEKLAHLPPGVLNPGFISEPDEMRRLFLSSDVVVAPSRADAFPGFLIEALSHGVPCVASSVGGVPEIVTHDADGFVLTDIEPQLWAKQIVSLMDDAVRLRQFSDAGRRKAAERFAWAPIADRIMNRLPSLVS